MTLLGVPWPLCALGQAQSLGIKAAGCWGSSVRAQGLSISGVGARASDTGSEVLAMEYQMLES